MVNARREKGQSWKASREKHHLVGDLKNRCESVRWRKVGRSSVSYLKDQRQGTVATLEFSQDHSEDERGQDRMTYKMRQGSQLGLPEPP